MIAVVWRAQVALGDLYQTQGRQTEADHAYASARLIVEELAIKILDEPCDLVEGISLRENLLRQACAMLPPPPYLTPGGKTGIRRADQA